MKAYWTCSLATCMCINIMESHSGCSDAAVVPAPTAENALLHFYPWGQEAAKWRAPGQIPSPSWQTIWQEISAWGALNRCFHTKGYVCPEATIFNFVSVCLCVYLQAFGRQSAWVGHISVQASVHSSQQGLGVAHILQVPGCPKVYHLQGLTDILYLQTFAPTRITLKWIPPPSPEALLCCCLVFPLPVVCMTTVF